MVTAVLLVLSIACSGLQELRREDSMVPGDAGITLFVRHVAPIRRAGQPVLLVHGARVPGIASFDLPVPGGSLAVDLATAGHDVYIMDARGYGASTRMPEMSAPPAAHPPLARSNEIVRDILAVVDWIRARHDMRPVLFGWATGGHWAGYFASIYSDRLGGLVMLNTLYGGAREHAQLGQGSDLADPRHPDRFRSDYGAYRLSAAASLLAAWDRSIPLEDKTEWRSQEVADAYVAAALASDVTSASRTPPSFRAPSGAMEDSFYLATGRQLWDASLIRVPTLVIRSENDFWSRADDAARLVAHIVHAPAGSVTIPNATHFVHLDRPERGRDRLLSELLPFLSRLRPRAQEAR